MKKNTAILLGALLLPAMSLPAFAQSSNNTDEGRPHTSSGPTRELTRMCRAEAKEKKLSGKERRSFMRDCQANQVPPQGRSGASGSASGSSAPGLNTDAEGRTQGNVNTSRISKKPPTSSGAAGAATTGTDAEGRARPK